MPRTIWLAFVCLLCLGALGALRASTSPRTIAARADTALPSAVEAAPPLAKSDRLPSLPPDLAEKASVATIKIAPEPPVSPSKVEAHQATSERGKITSWHWHAGSKIIRRTTSQPKSERER